MRNIFIGLVALIFNATLFSSYAYADAELLTVKTFKAMEEIANGLGEGGETLVVMDDDDTLTMMSCPDRNDLKTCQYLGGPAWYSWQEDLLNDNPSSEFAVANDSGGLIEISTLLFAINYMGYTEQEMPSVLHSLTKSGVKLLVLTARGSSTQSATANQFTNLNVKTDNSKQITFSDFIETNALVSKKSGLASIASPYLACGDSERPVSYQQGAMYVAGQNKGEMLKCLLESTESSSVKNIVFIDDTLANVEDVYTAFESNKKYMVKALHYTALQEHKNSLTFGKKAESYQKNANNRWLAIKAVLKNHLRAPALPE